MLDLFIAMSVGYGERFVTHLVSWWLTSMKEHVDLSALQQRGIKLGYTPDVLTDAGSIPPTYYYIHI
jgi:hypothetical protein